MRRAVVLRVLPAGPPALCGRGPRRRGQREGGDDDDDDDDAQDDDEDDTHEEEVPVQRVQGT